MARAASTCNYDNMRGSSCLHIVSAHPTSKRATQACRRTNAVAVGPVNMMCKLTLTLTNANANFFSSPARSHTDRVARRNCMPQLRASSFRARQNSQLHANSKPRLRPAASRNCGYQLHAATAGHCFHVVIITCVGLQTRRARGRVSLASSPAPKNTLMGITFAHHLM